MIANAMRIISLFAGIAGFDLGFERAGHETVAQVEIDKNCRKLLAAKFPHAVLREDVTTCDETNLPPCDLICGGFPCQDVSVAGKRAGLAGSRSGLFYELTRIISRLRPRFAILENVPGLFSSNGGRDFAAVLGTLAQLGARDVGWAVLDTQWRGLAQRRDRVFIVADFRGECAAEILSLSEGLRGDSPPSRETRQDVTGTFSARTSAGGGFGTDFESSGGLMPTMRSAVENGGSGHGARSGCKDEYIVPVTHALRAEGADASEDGTGRGTPIVVAAVTSKWAKGTGGPAGDECQNLVTAPLVQKAHADQASRESQLVVTPILEAGARTGRSTNDSGCGLGIGSENDPMFSLQSSKQHAVAISVCLGSDPISANDIAMPSTTRHGDPGVIANRYGVRRLTPRECERLQGFPDDWTAGFSDSVRYKMLGNAVAPPIAQYIGAQIAKVA